MYKKIKIVIKYLEETSVHSATVVWRSPLTASLAKTQVRIAYIWIVFKM